MGQIDIRVPTDDDFPTLLRLDGIAFGDPWPDDFTEAARATLDLERFRIACDGDDIVGIAGSYGMELTVPGGAQVPAGGVTWVSVLPTHRRRGILTRLMAELHDDIDARAEPLAILTASEGGIYERFGYGIASYLRVTEIDRRRTQVRPEFQPAPGSVRMTTLDDRRCPASSIGTAGRRTARSAGTRPPTHWRGSTTATVCRSHCTQTATPRGR